MQRRRKKSYNMMRLALIACCVCLLTACASERVDVVDLKPLDTYRITYKSGDQEHPLKLDRAKQRELASFCVRGDDTLPELRSKRVELKLNHHTYDELGEYRLKYWDTPSGKKISCLVSNTAEEYVSSVEALPYLENLGREEITMQHVPQQATMHPTEGTERMKEDFGIVTDSEHLADDKVMALHFPDEGTIELTFTAMRDGRTLHPIIDPAYYYFESGRNASYAYATHFEDGRVSFQIGAKETVRRLAMPDLFRGTNTRVIPGVQSEMRLVPNKRYLLFRLLVGERALDKLDPRSTSLTLSHDETMVIEVWGRVTTGKAPQGLLQRIRSINLVDVENAEGEEIVFDGGKSDRLFDLLKRLEPAETYGEQLGNGRYMNLYHHLTSQRFEVRVDGEGDELGVIFVDSESSEPYRIGGPEAQEVIDMLL